MSDEPKKLQLSREQIRQIRRGEILALPPAVAAQIRFAEDAKTPSALKILPSLDATRNELKGRIDRCETAIAVMLPGEDMEKVERLLERSRASLHELDKILAECLVEVAELLGDDGEKTAERIRALLQEKP